VLAGGIPSDRLISFKLSPSAIRLHISDAISALYVDGRPSDTHYPHCLIDQPSPLRLLARGQLAWFVGRHEFLSHGLRHATDTAFVRCGSVNQASLGLTDWRHYHFA
jgi:hypothetical protein